MSFLECQVPILLKDEREFTLILSIIAFVFIAIKQPNWVDTHLGPIATFTASGIATIIAISIPIVTARREAAKPIVKANIISLFSTLENDQINSAYYFPYTTNHLFIDCSYEFTMFGQLQKEIYDKRLEIVTLEISNKSTKEALTFVKPDLLMKKSGIRRRYTRFSDLEPLNVNYEKYSIAPGESIKLYYSGHYFLESVYLKSKRLPLSQSHRIKDFHIPKWFKILSLKKYYVNPGDKIWLKFEIKKELSHSLRSKYSFFKKKFVVGQVNFLSLSSGTKITFKKIKSEIKNNDNIHTKELANVKMLPKDAPRINNILRYIMTYKSLKTINDIKLVDLANLALTISSVSLKSENYYAFKDMDGIYAHKRMKLFLTMPQFEKEKDFLEYMVAKTSILNYFYQEDDENIFPLTINNTGAMRDLDKKTKKNSIKQFYSS